MYRLTFLNGTQKGIYFRRFKAYVLPSFKSLITTPALNFLLQVIITIDNNVNVHACTNFSVQKLGSLVNDLLQSLLCRRVSKAWQWENIGGSCTSIINVYTRCLRKVDISFRSSSVKYCCLVCNSSSSSVLHVHACNKCNKWIRTPVYASSNNRSNITKEQKNGYTCSYQYVQGWRQLHV